MGIVYQAFDPVVERHVALKTIRLDVTGSADLLDLFRREAKSIGRFEHPNIVTLYDAGEADGVFYMVMQLVQGETLRDRLSRQRWYKVPQVVDIFRQVLAGLGYAHERGVIHRDIKPANIMISGDGAVKLADFGIAKLMSPGASSSGLVVGTPSYMSPEQVLSRSVDVRSDLFSVGCTLYEVLTGEKAYPGDTATAVMYKIVHSAPARPASLRPGIDPRLEEVVLRALANDPDDRYPTCHIMAQALENCLVKPIRAGVRPLLGTVDAVQSAQRSTQTEDKAHATSKTNPKIKSSRRLIALSARIIPGAAAAILGVVLVVAASRGRRLAIVKPPDPPTVKTLEVQPPNPATVAPLPSLPAPAQSTAGEAERVFTREKKATTQAHVHTSMPRQPPTLQVLVPAPVERPPTLAARTVIAPVNRNEPEEFNTLILRGDEAFQKNAYDSALAAYMKASRLKPGNEGMRRKLRVVLTLLGRPAEAQSYR
jgi:serine/threonine-protein kinase